MKTLILILFFTTSVFAASVHSIKDHESRTIVCYALSTQSPAQVDLDPTHSTVIQESDTGTFHLVQAHDQVNVELTYKKPNSEGPGSPAEWLRMGTGIRGRPIAWFALPLISDQEIQTPSGPMMILNLLVQGDLLEKCAMPKADFLFYGVSAEL